MIKNIIRFGFFEEKVIKIKTRPLSLDLEDLECQACGERIGDAECHHFGPHFRKVAAEKRVNVQALARWAFTALVPDPLNPITGPDELIPPILTI
jgi:hypothetical protein